jgi:hypothetical protein
LFVIVAETLSLSIKRNKHIKGIEVKETEFKITQMADDTTLFIDDLQSLHHALNTLFTFWKASNLKLNRSKTHILSVGIYNTKEYNHFNLKWEKERVYALGTWFYKDVVRSNQHNYQMRLDNLKSILQQYSKLHLTWYGKIEVIKTFAIPKILYTISSLETPEWFVEDAQKAINSFLWDGKPPRIKFATAIANPELGGLQLPNIDCIVKASKAMWVKRLIASELKSLVFFDSFLPEMNFTHILETDIDPNNLPIDIPMFYRQILHSWFTLKDTCGDKVVWMNKDIVINQKPVFYKEWYKKGVVYLSHFLDNDGKTLKHEQFCAKYDIKCNFLDYLGIIQAISPFLKQSNKRTNCITDVNKISSKQLYQRQLENIQCKATGATHWSNKHSYHYSDEKWCSIYLMPKTVTSNNYLRELQLKINHHTYATDSYVHKFDKSVQRECKFCAIENDIIHWFVNCDKLTQFWQMFNKWAEPIVEESRLCVETTIFGVTKSENCELNFCLLVAKQYIHKTRNVSRSKTVLNFSFTGFLSELQQSLEIEKLIAIRKNTISYYNLRFAKLMDMCQ